MASGDSADIRPNMSDTHSASSSVYENPNRDFESTLRYLKKIKEYNLSEHETKEVTSYFADRKRKIDYVLVHEVHLLSDVFCRWCVKPKVKIDVNEIRRSYIHNLHQMGVQTERMALNTGNYHIFFILIHIPWNLLAQYAQLLHVKVPFREKDEVKNYTQYHWSYIFNKIGITFFNNGVPDQPKYYFTTDFKQEDFKRYIGSNDNSTFFKTAQRIRIAHEILEETRYGNTESEKGLEQLLAQKVFTTAYPIHDGPYKMEGNILLGKPLNERQILNYYWARYKNWHKYQPLDHIRQYNGEKIAFYYAFLGLYISWLIPLSLMGLTVFIWGIITVQTSALTEDVCTVPLSAYSTSVVYTIVTFPIRSAYLVGHLEGAEVSEDNVIVNITANGNNTKDGLKKISKKGMSVMCPLCDDGCEYWNISAACLSYGMAYITDHPGTVFYSVFTSIWAVSMLQAWRRLRIRLAYTWNCHDIVLEEERPRAHYVLKAPQMGINPITGLSEPTYPNRVRYARYVVTGSVFIVMVMCIFIFFVAVMLYRVIMSDELVHNQSLAHAAEYTSAVTGFVVNFIILKLLNVFYTYIAYKLSDWEVHRTQTEFDNHFLVKLFLFSAVNTYSSLLYIAFFKGRFAGYPGSYGRFLGARLETCDNDNCPSELALNTFVYFFCNLLIDNTREFIFPIYKRWQFRQKRNIPQMLKRVAVYPQWLEDYCTKEPAQVWKDLMELMTQFSLVTLFVAAIPISPFLALLINVVELRLDAKKYLIYNRRPFPERVTDLGIWSQIFQTIIRVSVFINGCIIAFTLDFLPKMIYMFDKGEWDLHGYIAFTMAYSVNMECRYHGYRDLDGNFTKFFWKLLFIRAAFVIIFEHFILAMAKVIRFLFPDIPNDVDIQIKRERYLAKQTFKPTDQ